MQFHLCSLYSSESRYCTHTKSCTRPRKTPQPWQHASILQSSHTALTSRAHSPQAVATWTRQLPSSFCSVLRSMTCSMLCHKKSTHACACTHTHTHTHARAHAHARTHTHTRMFIDCFPSQIRDIPWHAPGGMPETPHKLTCIVHLTYHCWSQLYNKRSPYGHLDFPAT